MYNGFYIDQYSVFYLCGPNFTLHEMQKNNAHYSIVIAYKGILKNKLLQLFFENITTFQIELGNVMEAQALVLYIFPIFFIPSICDAKYI